MSDAGRRGLTLLVLAAGMGSRFGGLKQFEPVGPMGQTLLDYSVFDALRAGFGRLVFVVREDFAKAFEAGVARRYRAQLRVDWVCQRLDDLPDGLAPPPGRSKPWGTTHAVLAVEMSRRGVEGERDGLAEAVGAHGGPRWECLRPMMIPQGGCATPCAARRCS